MDPLGQREESVDIATITRWSSTQLPLDSDAHTFKNLETSPFPFNAKLNNTVALWSGDPLLLLVDAIVNPTSESLNDNTGISGRIFTKAGNRLKQEIERNATVCKTGEACLTDGYGLLSRFIIHTVGPRYNVRYTTAAESALYSCYRTVLQLSRENSVRSVALNCIHSVQKAYPSEDGAHIAIRTVRRFLERHGDKFDLIIFVINDDQLKEIYQDLLPLYFPRSETEAERAIKHLPLDIGNEVGEPVIAERQIRIVDKPIEVDEPEKKVDDDLNESNTTDPEPCQNPFSQMLDDVDKTKRKSILESPMTSSQIEHDKRYQYLLKRAKQTDLSSINARQCFYQSGVDRMGRPVVMFIGKNLPTTQYDLEKVLLYFISIMDSIVVKEYIIVYFHTLTQTSNNSDLNFFRTIYDIVDQRYKKNLKSFYLVHPTMWSKLATWVFTTFRTSGMKQKVQSLAGIEHLYSRINPDQLDIPDFITDYDVKTNGRRYYIPSDREVQDAMEGL